MPAKKTAVRYRVLRDFGENQKDDVIDLTPETAAVMVRDGLVTPVEE